MIERSSHGPLRWSVPFSFHIGTLAHERQHTFLSKFRKPAKVDGVAKNRRVVNLKIACMHDDAGRRINRQRRRIADTVVCLDKFNTETAKIDGLSVFDHFSSGTS